MAKDKKSPAFKKNAGLFLRAKRSKTDTNFEDILKNGFIMRKSGDIKIAAFPILYNANYNILKFILSGFVYSRFFLRVSSSAESSFGSLSPNFL